MGKGLLRKKGLEGLRLKGHDRDDDEDGVIHKGHDTFKGKGLGHSKGSKGTKGSDGSGKCSDGSGKPSKGTGTKGSGTGTGGGDCHDYVCGGTLPCIKVEEGDTFVFDIDSPFRSSGDGNTIYAIVGGDDADLFEVNANGELEFKDGAVFNDGPDADNKYEVTVRATDIFNPCRPKDVTFCVEVTEDDLTSGGQGAAPTLSATKLIDPITKNDGGKVVATLVAFDAEGDEIFFEISGPDRAAFSISTANDNLSTPEVEAELIIKIANATSQQGANGEGNDNPKEFEITVTATDGASDGEPVELTFEHEFTSA